MMKRALLLLIVGVLFLSIGVGTYVAGTTLGVTSAAGEAQGFGAGLAVCGFSMVVAGSFMVRKQTKT